MNRRWLLGALLVVGLAISAQTRAAGDGYALVRGVADQSSVLLVQNNTYQLQASVGQPFAGTLTAGPISLGAEHWYDTTASVSTGRKLYVGLIRH
jgi:hypothetical protein